MNDIKFRPLLGTEYRTMDIPDSAWDSFVNLRAKINRFTFAVTALVFLLIGGIFGVRICWVGFFSLLSFGLILFFSVQSLAQQVEVRRISPPRGREGEEIIIEYEVINASQFSLHGFYIIDPFSGTASGQVYHEDPSVLLPMRRRHFSVKSVCNNGMGKFKLGPLQIVISDPLGIFPFVIDSRSQADIDVFPLVREIADIKLTGTKYSDSFGIYDQLNPGTSTSFMGIRPYVPGDAVKYISWKISAKANELMVKIFDRSVSDDISIFMDFTPAYHMGIKSESTWQMTKEITLGLTRQCLDHGNRVQILSQNLFIPWGHGEDYWSNATFRVGLHTPEFLKDKMQKQRELKDYLEILPRGSSAFFVTPFVLELSESTYDLVEKMRARSVDVFVFFIDTLTFVRGTHPLTLWSHFAADTKSRARQLDNAKLRLNSLGVPCYILAQGKEVGLAIIESELR